MSGQVEMLDDESVCVFLDRRAMTRQSCSDLFFSFSNVLLIASGGCSRGERIVVKYSAS